MLLSLVPQVIPETARNIFDVADAISFVSSTNDVNVVNVDT